MTKKTQPQPSRYQSVEFVYDHDQKLDRWLLGDLWNDEISAKIRFSDGTEKCFTLKKWHRLSTANDSDPRFEGLCAWLVDELMKVNQDPWVPSPPAVKGRLPRRKKKDRNETFWEPYFLNDDIRVIRVENGVCQDVPLRDIKTVDEVSMERVMLLVGAGDGETIWSLPASNAVIES